MKRLAPLVLLLVCVGFNLASTNLLWADSSEVTDEYTITLGPQVEAIPGDPAFLLPVKVSFSQPTVQIHIILNYDQNLLTPTLLAPNMFFQSFTYDISLPGTIKMDLTTELPPPPAIPPIHNDTTVAWLSFRVTTMDIGYDYLTHLSYVEYPLTPYPDNFIVLANDDIIASPPLNLVIGDVIIWHPDYGDINVNTYAWEIGDAVTFLNYFMGLTTFTRRQYANSDCNRDGVQATISDLVFLLRTISGSIAGSSELMPIITGANTWRPSLSLDQIAGNKTERTRKMLIDSEIPLGGASFEFDLGQDPLDVEEIHLGTAADSARLLCSLQGNKLKVSVVNVNGHDQAFACGNLFSIVFDNSESEISEKLKLTNAEFSNDFGQAVTAEYVLMGPDEDEAQKNLGFDLNLSGYPNPFNSSITVGFTIPSDGNYQLVAYDVLGRKVKTLWDGYHKAGSEDVVWNGTDSQHTPVASGTYFLRLHGDSGSRSLRLFLLK
jgi:hypothetical protein